MPSGKTHDRITIATAVAAAPAWWLLAPVHDFAVFASCVGAYVFSGLWMSDDLDTRCVALKRWGWFQFLWWPYQKMVPHRSWLSHGAAVGPILRVVYFAAMLWLVAHVCLGIVSEWIAPVNRDLVLRHFAISLLAFTHTHERFALWALAGLILGGLVHSAADVFLSTAKKIW